MDVLINNAAQTLRRPPQYYRHLIDAEVGPVAPGPLADKVSSVVHVPGDAPVTLPLGDAPVPYPAPGPDSAPAVGVDAAPSTGEWLCAGCPVAAFDLGGMAVSGGVDWGVWGG